MQLTDMINYVSRIFTPPPKLPGRERMIIPSLSDTRSLQQAKVDSQCAECAKLLAAHLYRWVKPYPEKSTIKTWNPKSLCFTGMDLDLFRDYLMQHFTLATQDGREWLLDRSIAALIWDACTQDGSPLPAASWESEMALKRKAAQ
jgi:hypothetical protein